MTDKINYTHRRTHTGKTFRLHVRDTDTHAVTGTNADRETGIATATVTETEAELHALAHTSNNCIRTFHTPPLIWRTSCPLSASLGSANPFCRNIYDNVSLQTVCKLHCTRPIT